MSQRALNTPVRTRLGLAAVAAVAVTGTLTAGLATPASATTAGAETFARQSKTMVVDDARIKEASGITRSTYSSDRVFIHNDSGDTNRVFAVNMNGGTDGVLTLKGAQAHDWEDIASGPDHTIWVGDIGNNGGKRSSIQVVSFTEPTSDATQTVQATTYPMAYEDRKWDAEAMMVDPQSGRVYVVTKTRNGTAGIYRAPSTLSTTKTNVMVRVGDAPDRVTGADFSPNGTSFVIRNYEQAFYYSKLGATPTVIDLPSQRQGESIGFDRSGDHLLIGSEGKDQPVWTLTN